MSLYVFSHFRVFLFSAYGKVSVFFVISVITCNLSKFVYMSFTN